MNIFKLLFQSIKLKLYVKIAKRNLQIIKYFEQQKEHLDEIMTNYKVENNLVELKTPVYKYYKVYINFSASGILKNEILRKDIPETEDIHYINSIMNITDEGYYCIRTKTVEYYGMFNNIKYPLDKLGDGLPYTQITDKDDDSSDGYYEKIITTDKYYHAIKEISHKEVDYELLNDEIRKNIKLVKDISLVKEEGYYKVIV